MCAFDAAADAVLSEDESFLKVPSGFRNQGKFKPLFFDVAALVEMASQHIRTKNSLTGVFLELANMGVTTVSFLHCLRLSSLFHHMSSLGRNPCNFNEGPAFVSKPFLPSVAMKAVEAFLREMDLNDVEKACSHQLVVASVEAEAAGHSFGDFFESTIGQAVDVSEFCGLHDGIGFLQRREKLVSDLTVVPTTALEQVRCRNNTEEKRPVCFPNGASAFHMAHMASGDAVRELLVHSTAIICWR